MCENIRQTFGIRSIRIWGKTDQTFVIKVQPQGMKTGEQNVDPKIKEIFRLDPAMFIFGFLELSLCLRSALAKYPYSAQKLVRRASSLITFFVLVINREYRCNSTSWITETMLKESRYRQNKRLKKCAYGEPPFEELDEIFYIVKPNNMF